MNGKIDYLGGEWTDPFASPEAREHGRDVPGTGLVLYDTPETRAWLDTLAIQKCQQWREANPEYPPMPPGYENYPQWRADHPDMVTAPYCCSAFCARCIGLRQLDHEPTLIPNGWMWPE